MANEKKEFSSAQVILEQALSYNEGKLEYSHPTLVSSGGISVPAPRSLKPSEPLFHILNTASDEQSTKVVSAVTVASTLDVVTNKLTHN